MFPQEKLEIAAEIYRKNKDASKKETWTQSIWNVKSHDKTVLKNKNEKMKEQEKKHVL